MMVETPSTILARLQSLSGPAHATQRASTILTSLESESLRVREAAIGWAARWLEPATLTDLVAHDENATLRNAALSALARQGHYAVTHLQKMLQEKNPEVVMFAAQVLAQIGSPESVPALLPLVRHADANVAQVAIGALGRVRAVEAVPALLELLHADLWLQLAAVEALGDIGEVRAEPALLALVPASEVTVPALQALARLGGPVTLERVLGHLQLAELADLREPMLLTAGAILERHPSGQGMPDQFGSAVDADRSSMGLWRYLAGVLQGAIESPEPAAPLVRDDRAQARGGGPLVQAGGTLAIAAGIVSLYPDVMIWASEPAGAAWVEPLCQRHPEALDASLLALLGHLDPRVRRGALLAGAFRRDHLPLLRSALGDPEAEVRAAACWALADLVDPDSIEPLLELLHQGGTEERTGAIAALGRLPGEALKNLEPCLSPAASTEEILAALEVAERSGSRLFDARVWELLKSPTASIRRAALKVVGAIEDSHAEVALLRALADRDQGIQVEALSLLVRRGGDRVTRTLLALLSTGDSLRYHVIRALGRLHAAEAAPMLESLLATSAAHERIEIISALVRIGPPGIMPLLRERLAERDPDIRRAAALGVSELARSDDLSLLLQLAQDPDWYLRHEAARGLGKLKLPACRDPLLELVRDLEPVVAQAARRALEESQGGSRSARP